MLDVKYYKDYGHNYFIIKCDEKAAENTYQRKMITSNPIRGLLQCQERHVNGELLLYYEITSKQSLLNIYAQKSIGLDLIHKIFLQLKSVSELLQKYLLDEKGLMLQPEYVFLNVETEEFSFLYYPDPGEDSFSGLMDFLMERVDSEDAQAVEVVYKIADLIHREQFVLDEVLNWFQDREVEKEMRRSVNAWQDRPQNTFPCEPSVNTAVFDVEELEDGTEEAGEKGKWAYFPFGASILGIGILIYIMYQYELGSREKLLLTAGWCGAIFLLLGSLVWYLYWTYLYKKVKTEKAVEHSSGEWNQTFEYEAQNQDFEDCGDTVFIPWIDSCENRLYGMDRGNKYHIDLSKLPLTVGKLAGATDMVINEQSISRLHAKFSRVGNKICITDLNSTNGTFKNGLRLQPNDSEIIEPGDEIRLGKLKFIYR